ncbi:MAG: histidine kinase [Pseudobdellovibrionaceae bacterium]
MKPFVSILLIIGTLFTLVFLQMEERRLGYGILKLTREQRQIVDEKRDKVMQLAKVTRPQHVENMAQRRFTLKKVQASQIIHLSGAQQMTSSRSRELN